MSRIPAVYLVERLEPNLELIEESDVTLHLSVAVQTVVQWFQDAERLPRVRVSLDRQGLLEGIGFFDEHDALLARIAVYWLDREDTSQVDPDVDEAVSGELAGLQARLQQLF
jgi:shikimate kinase